MKRKERLEIFKRNLSKIVEEGNEGSFVIFDTIAEKFVQFAGSKEEGGWLHCDIPLQELSKEEEKRLRDPQIFDKNPPDAEYEELTSYAKDFDKEDLNKAVELIERIFIEVFSLPYDYNVNVELNLGD